MGKIPESYLPPRDLWPDYTMPEQFKDMPEKLNICQEFIDRHIDEGRANNHAIYFMDKMITYGQLQKMVNRFANALRKMGVEPQDRVGLRVVNSPPAIVAIYGIFKIGAIPVPTSPLWSKEEVAFVVNNAEMKAFVVNEPLMGEVEKAKDSFETAPTIIVVGGNPADIEAKGYKSYEKMIEGESDACDPEMVHKDDIGVILYTSGTTGPPKGCVHFVREVYIESHIVGDYVWKLTPSDVLGGSAPVSFAAGFGTFGLIPFAKGSAISLLPKFTPQDMLELFEKHGITVATGLPTAYRALMKFPDFKKYDLSKVRMFTSGGDALGVETFNAWLELTGKPIWEGLGGTEMLHLVTSNTMGEKPVPGSIGKPLPGFEIKLITPEGNEAKPGEVGSFCVKGPTGTVYWKPYADDNRLLKSQQKGVRDGFNLLGDAVYADENGYLFFVAREDDMIKSSGYRISPAEVEEVIAKYEAVADVGVVGIPDPEKGQITKACIVLKEGYQASDEMKEKILNFCREHIAVYKLPRIIEFMDALPRTPTGKLLRRMLK
ncbi:MAG: acyl-CoA synthetase [Syntrophobacterales bacterium]|nr:acyl-CoA synthetase [Syntrophobacterales bacterium]